VTLSAVSVAVNVGLSLLLVRGLGFAGLALATSCAALVNAGLCVLVLRSHLDGLGGRPLAVTTLKVLVAAAVMSAVVAAVNHVAAPVGHAGLARQAASLGLVILSGVGALALAARALGIEAFDDVWTRVAGKLRPSPAR
jgi:putative peptidoglycan lipid II flippase